VTEEDIMNLVNSKDVVADRIRELQVQAASAGRPSRHSGQWHALAAWAAARILGGPKRMIKTVEEL
jgi:hypothetical protein